MRISEQPRSVEILRYTRRVPASSFEPAMNPVPTSRWQQRPATVLVLQWGYAPAARTQVELTTEQRIELAAEAACEKPFIRNLRGQQLYDACLVEVRAEVEAALAAREAGTELAVR